MRLSIAQITIVTLVTHSVAELLLAQSDHMALRALLAIVGFVAVIAIPSILLSKFFALVTKQTFTRVELLNISAPIGLLILPGLLLLESNVIRQLSPALLAINSIISLLLLACFPAGRDFLLRPRRLWRVQVTDIRHDFRLLTSSPLFWTTLFYVILVTHINTLYSALPDLDPYTWLSKFNKFLVSQTYPTSLQYRPLFLYLMYYLTEGLQLPAYVIFKYIFPYLAVLTILPAWLVAQTYKNVWSQTAVLMIPLMVPSTVLYLQLPIPQAVVTILAYFFTLWLIYAWQRNTLFYYLAGCIAFLGFFHHESIAFFALAWLVVTGLFDYRQIISFFRHNTLIASLLAILLVSNAQYFSYLLRFIYRWSSTLKKYVHYNPNWEFPAKYINIDDLNVGWPGIAGVTKYYLFYAGPEVIAVVLLAIILLLTNLSVRKKMWLALHNKASALLVVTFSVFLILTEIVPRVMSVALLPDRLWIFLGATSTVFFFILLDQLKRKDVLFVTGIFCLFAVSISGAIYINYLKQFIIPNYQVAAATWIKENLPTNRVILTDHHTNLVTYFAQSPIIPVSDTFYCDPNVIADENLKKDEVLRERLIKHDIFKTNPVKQSPYFHQALSTFLQKNQVVTPGEAQRFIAAYREPDQEMAVVYEAKEHPHAYILYAPNHSSHPYAARSYGDGNAKNVCTTPVFDQYPNRFKKVYQDGTRVIIWQWN